MFEFSKAPGSAAEKRRDERAGGPPGPTETHRVSLKLDPWVASEPYSILEFVHIYPASNSFLLFLRNLERIFDIKEWGKIKDKRSGSGEKERLKDIGWNGLIERKFNNFKWRAEGNCGRKLTVTEWLAFSLNWPQFCIKLMVWWPQFCIKLWVFTYPDMERHSDLWPTVILLENRWIISVH